MEAAMTKYEVTVTEAAVLDIVEKGHGAYDCYNIEISLSSMDVPRDPGAMAVLKDLATRGLVRLHVRKRGSRGDRWKITELGMDALRVTSVPSKRADNNVWIKELDDAAKIVVLKLIAE